MRRRNFSKILLTRKAYRRLTLSSFMINTFSLGLIFYFQIFAIRNFHFCKTAVFHFNFQALPYTGLRLKRISIVSAFKSINLFSAAFCNTNTLCSLSITLIFGANKIYIAHNAMNVPTPIPVKALAISTMPVTDSILRIDICVVRMAIIATQKFIIFIFR